MSQSHPTQTRPNPISEPGLARLNRHGSALLLKVTTALIAIGTSHAQTTPAPSTALERPVSDTDGFGITFIAMGSLLGGVVALKLLHAGIIAYQLRNRPQSGGSQSIHVASSMVYPVGDDADNAFRSALATPKPLPPLDALQAFVTDYITSETPKNEPISQAPIREYLSNTDSTHSPLMVYQHSPNSPLQVLQYDPRLLRNGLDGVYIECPVTKQPILPDHVMSFDTLRHHTGLDDVTRNAFKDLPGAVESTTIHTTSMHLPAPAPAPAPAAL